MAERMKGEGKQVRNKSQRYVTWLHGAKLALTDKKQIVDDSVRDRSFALRVCAFRVSYR